LGRESSSSATCVLTWNRGDREETGKFLQSSLAKAGGERKVFADDAEARLHELADGIPRAVSSLAELALLAGAGNQLPMVDVMTVESVYHELVAGR
jgi:type II secretory pathway predicted ATPase ExeA